MVLRKILFLLLPLLLFSCYQNTSYSNYNDLVKKGWERANINDVGYGYLEKLSDNGNRNYHNMSIFFLAETDNNIFAKISECDFSNKNNDCLKDVVETGITIKMLNKLAEQKGQYFSFTEYELWLDNILSKKRTYSENDLLKISKSLFSTTP